MTDLIEEIPVLPARKQKAKKIPTAIIITSPANENELKVPVVKSKASASAVPTNHYMMPPQPEAYIKSPRYDFF